MKPNEITPDKLKEAVTIAGETVKNELKTRNYPTYMVDFLVDSFSRCYVDTLRWSALSGIEIEFKIK